MQILKRGTPKNETRHIQYEFKCPECKSKLKACDYELEYSYISDYSFKCPVCAARRHLGRKDLTKVE